MYWVTLDAQLKGHAERTEQKNMRESSTGLELRWLSWHPVTASCDLVVSI